jgi:hypothetical protein
MDFPVRIAQTRTRREKQESQKGLNRQISSTSGWEEKIGIEPWPDDLCADDNEHIKEASDYQIFNRHYVPLVAR